MFRNKIFLIIILFFGSQSNVAGNPFYFGYYIYPINLRNILIVKLSLQEQREYYTLDRFSFADNELFAKERTILNRQINYRRSGDLYRMLFIERDKEVHRTNNYIVFDINEDRNNYLKINYYINNTNYILSLENSYFTKDFSEITDIINSNCSENAYTGKFVLDEYEIIDILNMENPINEEEVIVIDIYERRNTILCLTHFSAGEVIRDIPFFVRKEGDINRISTFHADGNNWGSSRYYYYLNKDTIIFEYDWGGRNDNNEYASIKYRIKFVREQIPE